MGVRVQGFDERNVRTHEKEVFKKVEAVTRTKSENKNDSKQNGKYSNCSIHREGKSIDLCNTHTHVNEGIVHSD